MFCQTWIQEWCTAAYLKARTVTRLLHICTFVPRKRGRSRSSDPRGTVRPRAAPHPSTRQLCADRRLHRRSPLPITICRSVSEFKNEALLIFRTSILHRIYVHTHTNLFPYFISICITDWCINTHMNFCSTSASRTSVSLIKTLINCVRLKLASPISFFSPLFFSNFFLFF